MADNTDTTAPATETQEPEAAPSNQENAELTQRLADYEKRVQELAKIEERAKTLEAEHKASQADSLRWHSAYKGLQRQTTQSMQTAAEDRRRLSELERVNQQLLGALGSMEEVKQSIVSLAAKTLDEDGARDFQLSQREAALKRQEALAQQRAQMATQPPPVQQYQPYMDPEEQRKQFLEAYFPGSGLDPNDPNIDWAEDATNPSEAMSRFTRSVYGIFRAVQGQQPAPEVAGLSDAQQLLEQIRQETESMQASRTKMAEELRAEARRDVEERLRRMGVDQEPVNNRTTSSPRIETQLNELDETSMMTGDVNSRRLAQKRYSEQVEEVKRQLRAKYS